MAHIRDATLADVGLVYELLAARSRAAFGVSEVSRDFVAAEFGRPGLADRWVAEQAGAPVGYAHLTSTGEYVSAAADTNVAEALLARAEARADEQGFHVIEATVVPEDTILHELVRRSGFARQGEVLRMWRVLDGELPEPSWPDGVAVRTYTDDDATRVHALLDEAYGAWDASYVPRQHEEWLAFMTEHAEFDPTMWFLVERDGKLVACALHWREHQRRGWVKDLVVRGDERGRGIGHALLHLGFRAYAERAVERVGLKVDSANPTGAVRLYERTGFAVDRRYEIWRKPL